mgnify:CR=1 FL=1
MEVRKHPKHPGVYTSRDVDGSTRLLTLSLAPGHIVYGERTVLWKGEEYRMWDPFRSKLAAAILKGVGSMTFGEGDAVLYLGAASGTTVSHVSDILGPKGRVYAVEFAPRVMRELLERVCAHRSNVVPILGDARRPESYRALARRVTSIYCDVAQPEQAKIAADNADAYLESGSEILLFVKARSIDSTAPISDVFSREKQILAGRGFTIEETVELDPFDRDHLMVRAKFGGVGAGSS